MSTAYCPRYGFRAANVAAAHSDLAGTARLANRNGSVGERAQRLIPEKRARLDAEREQLAAHLAGCDDCAKRQADTA